MNWVTISALLIWTCGGVADNNVRTIWCVNDDITSQRNLVKGMNKADILCEAKGILSYPFTFDSEETPPKPESLNVTYRTYKVRYHKDNVTGVVTNKQIAIKLSWTYKIQYLPKVESFHVEVIFFKPPGRPKQYLLTWNSTLESVLLNSDAQLVEFSYIFCGAPGNFHINPKDIYWFKVQAYPIYQESDDPQVVRQMLKIPGCEDRVISRVEMCACREGYRRRHGRCRKIEKSSQTEYSIAQNTTATIPVQKPKLSSTHLILLIIGVFLIVVFVLFAIWAYKEREIICVCCIDEGEKAVKKRHVLLISTFESGYLEPMNNLINMLSSFPHLEVKSNLRQRNEIGELGVHEWTKCHIDAADVVVFFIASTCECCEDSKLENESMLLGDLDRQANLVLKATEKIIINNKAENENKKFVMIGMKASLSKREYPYFKHYKLPCDFNKFARTVIGKKGYVKEKDKKIFLLSLNIAQLGGYGNKAASSEDPILKKVTDDVSDPTNDLNCGTRGASGQSLDDVNVYVTDSFESQNNISTQPYISSDANGGVSCQFKSGARRKQS